MDFLVNFPRYWAEHADPRVLHLLLVNSVYQIPLILFAYLYFVFICGPRFMKNRSPYSLKTFIKLYNIGQIIINMWLVYNFMSMGIVTRKLFCPMEVDYTTNPESLKIVRHSYYYFLLKVLDLVETGIFILRKKDNQVSILHVYHHVSVVLISWMSMRYFCIAPLSFICVINCFVHGIMYSYYLLASYGPKTQKMIAPVKRWITIIQMVQFGIILLYLSQNFIPNCKVTSHISILIFMQTILMNFYLFYNFYKKTYTKSKKI